MLAISELWCEIRRRSRNRRGHPALLAEVLCLLTCCRCLTQTDGGLKLVEQRDSRYTSSEFWPVYICTIFSRTHSLCVQSKLRLSVLPLGHSCRKLVNFKTISLLNFTIWLLIDKDKTNPENRLIWTGNRWNIPANWHVSLKDCCVTNNEKCEWNVFSYWMWPHCALEVFEQSHKNKMLTLNISNVLYHDQITQMLNFQQDVRISG